MEIVLAMGSAELTGTVRDADEIPAAGAVVALVPDEGSRQGRWGRYRGTQADQNGQFELRDLAPGEYNVLAWEDVDPEVALDPELHRHFGSKAIDVKLAENGRETVELEAIPAEEVDKVLW